MKKKKQRRCRICKKRPVWTHGDVKDPGPVCKRCYHKHVWPDRKVAGRTTAADPGDDFAFRPSYTETIPFDWLFDRDDD